MEKIQLVSKKYKKFIKNKTFKITIVSFLTVIVTVFILFVILWSLRDKILSYVASNYLPKNEATKSLPILIEKVEEVIVPAPIIAQKEEKKVEVVKEEETVVSAVKKTKAGVVSIVVNKEFPKYDVLSKEDGSDGKESVPVGTQYKQVGSGSGFIISSDGMIITNRHVVDKTDVKYTVLLNSGLEYEAKVLARDPVLDVAILKIEVSNLPYLKLADSDDLQVGQSVVAIGNALGEFKNTVSTGVISGLSRSFMATGSGGFKEFLYKVLQTDAAINPGNSGGPLLNLSGEVVGINVALAEGSSNIGFSLPINSVKSVIEQVKKTGKISRPYVGVRYINIDQKVSDKLKLSVIYGVLIQKGGDEDVAVIPGSPAERAGLLENDIILSVDGEIISVKNDFMALIRSKTIGDIITLRVLSNGIEKNVSLKLEELPENF